MINKYVPRRVDLVGWRFFIIIQGFHDKSRDWKQDFFFASYSDLGHDDLTGTWHALNDFDTMHPEVDPAREFSSRDRASYRQLARLLDNGPANTRTCSTVVGSKRGIFVVTSTVCAFLLVFAYFLSSLY